MRLPLDISYYESVNFSFYYWASTGTLNDYFDVNYGNGSGYVAQLWNQTVANSGGWQQVIISIPSNATYIEFDFTSDSYVGGGPYEGVYIDDCSITAVDSTTPTSSAGALPTYCNKQTFNVNYTASDTGGAGMAYVELWYRRGTSGPFSKYSTFGNPTGHWTSSPIALDSSLTGGDGLYELYTVAVDAFGNSEPAPGACDASTTVDTVPPWTGLFVAGTEGLDGWYRSAVVVTVSPTDAISGVASIQYKITGGPQQMGSWQTYNPAGISLSLDGNHSISFNMTDNAGNYAVRKDQVLVDKVAPSSYINLTGTMGNGDWYKVSVAVNLTASDATSGVTSIFYSIDGGTTVAYDDDFTIMKGGTTTVSYFSADNAGNSGIGTPKSIAFKLDPAGPSCQILGAPSVFTSTGVSINWQGQDNESGIDHYEISFDNSAFASVDNQTSANRILADGQHTFKLRAIDIAGNTGTVRELNFTVDTNIFSPTGPMGPLLDLAIILPVIAAILYIVLKRRGKSASPKQPAQ
jgi:hypothetical protein